MLRKKAEQSPSRLVDASTTTTGNVSRSLLYPMWWSTLICWTCCSGQQSDWCAAVASYLACYPAMAAWYARISVRASAWWPASLAQVTASSVPAVVHTPGGTTA